jgi:hypothetical protein
MLGFATIRKDGFPKEWLDQQRWRSLIGEFPELKRIETISIGPQTHLVPESAEMVDEAGQRIGVFLWENGQIYVDGPFSMFPLAKGIAEILDAYVFNDAGDEMLEVPEDE